VQGVKDGNDLGLSVTPWNLNDDNAFILGGIVHFANHMPMKRGKFTTIKIGGYNLSKIQGVIGAHFQD